MNKLLAIIFVLFTIYQIGLGRKCYFQNDPRNNTKYESKECNSVNAMLMLLKLNHTYEIPNNYTGGQNYDCIKLNIKDSGGIVYDRGCIYDDRKFCSFNKRSNLNFTIEHCSQCTKDNCNPADRAASQIGVIGVSVIIAILTKVIH